MNLDQLNNLPEREFSEYCMHLLEHCEWALPLLAKKRPYRSTQNVKESITEILSGGSKEQQMKAIKLHPKLGVEKAQPGFSASEQQDSGLKNLSEVEFELFTKLNLEYEDRHGFPFILAVKGYTKQQIIEAMKRRTDNSSELEYEKALAEVIKIAQIRVDKLVTA